MGRVKYLKQWEKKAAPTLLRRVGETIRRDTATELRRTGLLDDPPAREYLAELDVVDTDTGVRVLTTAGRAHFVEYGTIYREPDAPMRTAARRAGAFRES